MEIKRNVLLKYGISQWKSYHEIKKHEWKENIILNTKLHHLYLKRSVKYWNKWSKQQYHSKQTIKYQNIVKIKDIILIKRCLQYWCKCTKSIYQNQKMYIKASAYCSIRQQRLCILKWNQITIKQSNVNMKYQQLKQKTEYKIIQQYLLKWKKKKEFIYISIKITVLLNKYANRLYLFRTFNQWKYQYQYQHVRNDVANRFRKFKLKKKVLKSFKKNVEYTKHIQNKLNNYISNPDQNQKYQLQIAYMKWKNNTNTMKLIKHNLQKDIKLKILHWWRRYHMKQEKLKYFENKLNYKHKQYKLKSIFIEWNMLINGNLQSKLFLVSSYLHFWYKTTKKHRRITQKSDALQKWVHLCRTNKLFIDWFLMTQDKMELNQKINISIHFYNDKLKVLMFRSWIKHIMTMKKEKKMTKKIKNKSKRLLKKRMFYHWHSIYDDHQIEMETNRISLRYLMHKYVKCWNAKTKLTKKKRFYDYKSKLFYKKIYFTKWSKIFEPCKIGYQYERQLTLSIKPYINAINKNFVSSAFEKWYTVAAIKSMEQYRRNKKMFKYFKSWKKLVKKRKHKQQKLRKKINLRTKHDTFKMWIHLCKQTKKATQFADTAIQRRLFTRWRIFVDKKELIYCWNQSIVVGIIDDVLDGKQQQKQNEFANNYQNNHVLIDEKLIEIEKMLKQLLDKKLKFKENCKQFMKLKNNEYSYTNEQKDEENDDILKELENDICSYIRDKSNRKLNVLKIINKIGMIYQYVQQQAAKKISYRVGTHNLI